MRIIGEIIRDLRNERGLSMGELARRAGISRPYLSQLENNKFNNPSLQVLEKIAKGLGINYNELTESMNLEVDLDSIQTELIDINSKKLELKEELSVKELQLKLLDSLRTTEKLIKHIETLTDLHKVLNVDSDLYYKDHLLTLEEKQKLSSIIETVLD